MPFPRSPRRVLFAAALASFTACAENPTAPAGSQQLGQSFVQTSLVAGATLVFGENGVPANCAEAQAALAGATDGAYVVGPATGPTGGSYFVVYCADMAGAAREYLSLASTGPGKNYSSTSSHTPLRTTSFTKVRLDPATLRVDIGDATFSTTAAFGGWASRPVAYTTASNCQGGPGAPRRSANVDLNGTAFSVNSSFVINGWDAHGSVNANSAGGFGGQLHTFAVQAKEVNLTGGGFCGGVIGGADFHHGIFLYNPGAPKPGFSLQLAFDGPSLNIVSFANLGDAVRQFVANEGIANSLCAKLQAAEASAARGNASAKTGQLNAFRNHVAAQTGKALTQAQASFLLSWANQL